MDTDSANNRFEEVNPGNGEKVRVTYVEDSWNGRAGLRIQIRDATGHLRQGPEIPKDNIPEVIAVAVQMVIARQREGAA